MKQENNNGNNIEQQKLGISGNSILRSKNESIISVPGLTGIVNSEKNNNSNNNKYINEENNKNMDMNNISLEKEQKKDSVVNEDNNEKNESLIYVPGLSTIVVDDFNLKTSRSSKRKQEENKITNADNINKNKEEDNKRNEENDKKNENEIDDNIVFASKISQMGEKNNSVEKKENINDNKEGTNEKEQSQIFVPGFSQIIIKDSDYSNDNENSEEKNKSSVKDIGESNNNMQKLKNSNNKRNGEFSFNLLNSRIEDSLINNNSMKNNSQNNTIDINNSLSLLKNDSSEIKNEDNEELPKIHNHGLIKCVLLNNVCSVCSRRIRTKIGFMCEECSLIICEACFKLVISNKNLNDKHMHPLLLIEKNDLSCNKCNNSKNIFYFCCDECNFRLCPHCFLSNN